MFLQLNLKRINFKILKTFNLSKRFSKLYKRFSMDKYDELKNHGYDKKTIDYLNLIGNRISQSKNDLIKETFETFPDKAIMLSNPSECELLKMLVQITGTKKAIEVGTFTGYSALCIAEGLPENGKLYCFDINEDFTNLAKKHWKLNNVENKIILSLENGALSKLLNEESNLGTFDFAYVDADKPGYIKYYEDLLKLLRPNGIVVFDNMWYSKKVVDENTSSSDAKALRELALFLQKDERVDINMLDIADGITIVRKR